MPNLIDNLFEQAVDQYGKHAPDWFDKLLASARNHLPDKNDPDPATRGAQMGTSEALRIIEDHKDDLIDLGEHGLILVLTHISTGRYDLAALAYLREKATLEELLLSSAASGMQMLKDKAADDKRTAETIALLKTIGALAARYALPILLSVATGL